MSAGLIKHLKKKTEEDPNTSILMSQWTFDEKLVGKSLENVGSYYPHFSSHNESHSQQILVNIERLLGDNINKLTATDTWLILEAAYWHDIGMLFNADEVQEVFENEQFKEYVESLSNDNTQDLHDFAKVWHEDGWNKALVQFQDPHTGVEKYRQMVAEWYRRGHAKNSNTVVLDPFEKLGINSPRTELLPKRIYRYLGQICWSHGLGFDYVMNDLPFRQTGMGTENCHPRFVASLLRLGDLFDIDDNRFCPVMARQVGNMPSFSETHKHKHQSIREFQLDNETVSVTAICNTEMAYIECRRWFDWIREEIQNQMSQWKNIVPSRDFGLLPTIDKLDVEMVSSRILLNEKPMKFSLDEKSAIELLQGNNLYKDDTSIYRELIQNAIDATMIRVWLEHGQKYSKEKLPKDANPYDEDTRSIFEKYPITLDFKKVIAEDDSVYWQLVIEDSGTGISRKDLNYMQKIAGSKNNKEKQKLVRQMPEWLRPSGEFGIGLHSAFLLMKDLPPEHQKITIFTKSCLTHESLKIELNSPLSGKAGYCFIEKVNDLGSYGTRLVVNTSFNEKKHRHKAAHYAAVAVEYDLNSSIILDQMIFINEFIIHNNPFKLKFSQRLNKVIEKNFRRFQNLTQYALSNNSDYNKTKAYWNKEHQFALTLFLPESLSDDADKFSDNIIMYKGQSVDKYNISDSQDYSFYRDLFFGYKYKIDIYSSDSRSYLKLSRDEWNFDFLREKLITFSDAFLNSNLNNYLSTVSAFNDDLDKNALFSYYHNPTNETLSNIKSYKVDKKNSIGDLLNLDSFMLTNNIQALEKKGISLWENYYECKFYPDTLINTILKFFKNQGYCIYENNKIPVFSKKNTYNLDLALYLTKDKINKDLQYLDFNKQIKNEDDEDVYLADVIYHLLPSLHPTDRRRFIAHESLIAMPHFNLKNSNRFASINIEGKIYVPFVLIDDSIIQIESNKYVSFIQTHKPEVDKSPILEQYADIINLILNEVSKGHIYERWTEAYSRGQNFELLDLSIINM